MVAPYVGAWIETYSMPNTSSHSPVAPYVGAWIETVNKLTSEGSLKVAPYVGAWIETLCAKPHKATIKVAPYVGAWIETCFGKILFIPLQSHPMWVRGLKHNQVFLAIVNTRRTLCGCVD